MEFIRIVPAGDRALLAQLEQKISEDINDRVRALMEALKASVSEGIVEMIPSYCSLLVFYDPLKLSYSELKDEVLRAAALEREGEKPPQRLLRIPCCYGSHFGLDLNDMEGLTGLSKDEIIAIHSGTDYRVYMLGFLPGFVYLGGLDKRINAPRLTTPRVGIPRGSVAIGGAQTGVYPLRSPGGWRIIGATPVEFFDPSRNEPVLCRAGDLIRFEPVTACDYYDIRQEMLKGRYEVRITEAGDGN